MPKAVTNLSVTDVKTTAIQLSWLRQSDYKPSYSYLVIALQGAQVVENNSTKMENYTFFNLVPGKPYSFRVFTVVEGVKSTVENTSSYTSMPSKLLTHVFIYTMHYHWLKRLIYLIKVAVSNTHQRIIKLSNVF